MGSHTQGQTGIWSGIARARLRLVGWNSRHPDESMIDYASRLARIRREMRGQIAICIDGLVYEDGDSQFSATAIGGNRPFKHEAQKRFWANRTQSDLTDTVQSPTAFRALNSSSSCLEDNDPGYHETSRDDVHVDGPGHILEPNSTAEQVSTSAALPEASFSPRPVNGSNQDNPDNQDHGPSHPGFGSNPLIDVNEAFVAGSDGKYWYMGPTSSWSFCRRVLSSIASRLPDPTAPPDPWTLNRFQLNWSPLAKHERPIVDDLPAQDYAVFLAHTVKYHLGTLSLIIDDDAFFSQVRALYQNPTKEADRSRIWYAQFLLVLAFGEAITNKERVTPVPGTQYACRALSMVPHFFHVNKDSMVAVETLCLAGLYLQSLDLRPEAFQTSLTGPQQVPSNQYSRCDYQSFQGSDTSASVLSSLHRAHDPTARYLSTADLCGLRLQYLGNAQDIERL
ncbi:hypothetical protein ACJ41O_006515 [Fusarium nematophilum]